MVTSPDHTNNLPTPIHSNDNSQSEYQPSLIYCNDNSQREYQPTLIYSNDNSQSEYKPTPVHSNANSPSENKPTLIESNHNSESEYQPTLIHSNDNSQSEYQPTLIYSSDNSQSEYEPTPIHSNDNSQSEYKPTPIHSNDNSQSEYTPTLILSNDNSQSEYKPTLILSNDNSQSEYQPTLIHSNDNSQSEYQPTPIHSNNNSQNEYQPTLIHSSDNSQSEYQPTLILSNDNSQSESSQTPIYLEEPLICGICCKEFNQMRLLRVHMRTHNEEQPYKYNIRSKGFKGKKEFQLHMKTHTEEQPYKCDMCSKAYGRRSSLTRHKLIHHSHLQSQIAKSDEKIAHTEEQPYKCDICSKAYGRRSPLTRHKHIHHGHLQSKIAKSDEKIATLKDKLREFFRKNTGKKPDATGEVNTMVNVRHVFKNGQDSTGTKTANEQNIAVVNDKSFSQVKQSLVYVHKRKETSDNLPFRCMICGKGFKGEIRLQVHMRIHTGETPYKCDICSKGFTQRCTLANHKKIHTVHCKVCDFANCQCHLQKYSTKGEFDARTETCNICCKEFKGKKVFLIHMRTHTGEQPYKCDICSKGFIGETKLQLHMRTHTGEKPYKCDICSKAFGRRTSLTRHKNIHHGHRACRQTQILKSNKRISAASKNKLREYFRKNNGKKLDKCGEFMNIRNVFDNDQDLTGTKIANEENICVVNDKSFSQNKQSLLHKRKKSYDNLPVKTCKICSKGFIGEIRLQIHMRTHTGDTPYKCDICSKGFIQRCTLANHKKIHDIHCKVCDFANCQCHLQKFSPKDEFAASKNILRKFLTKQTEINPDKHGVNNTIANVSNHLSNEQEPTRTGTENEQFICGVCGEIFSGDIPLVLHMRKHACEVTNTMVTDKHDISIDHDHTISKNDQDNHDQTLLNTDQDNHDLTILNTDQEFTKSKNDQHHHDHTISNIKIEQFVCGVCGKSFSGENKLRLHTTITHTS